MLTAYHVSCEEGNYTHTYVDGTYLDLDEAVDAFYDLVRQTEAEGADTTTDYISLEKVTVSLDNDGSILDIEDFNDVVMEHTINEYLD